MKGRLLTLVCQFIAFTKPFENSMINGLEDLNSQNPFAGLNIDTEATMMNLLVQNNVMLGVIVDLLIDDRSRSKDQNIGFVGEVVSMMIRDRYATIQDKAILRD